MPGVATSPIGSGSGDPANCHASPPSASFASTGALSWYCLGSHVSQMWGGSSTWASADTIRNVMDPNSSLTLVSGFKGSAPFLDGVRVAVDGDLAPLVTAADILCDLGASAVDGIDRADVVLSTDGRSDGAAPDAVWVRVTPFGGGGPRSSWRAS